MANTVSIDALRQELWRKEVFADRMDKLFFHNKQLMGEGDNVVVQVMNNLKKDQGDTVTFGLVGKITDAPVTGDNELEGNEIALNSYSESVAIDQFRFGVRTTGRLDDQKSIIDFRKQGREKIAMAQAEFIENQIFMKLGGVSTTTLTRVDGTTYSANATWSNTATAVPAADEAAGTGERYVCADASGLDSIAATDIFTADLITKAKIKAQLAGPRIAPLRIDGQDFYVCFLHPWQVYDLRHGSSSIWDQAQRDAQTRGNSNPIFSGSLGIYNGVILHEHEYVPTVAASAAFGSGGTAAGARAFRALLCGRQAAVMAEGSKSNIMDEETFDYGNKNGVAVNFIGGIQKPTFNSEDYGVVAIDTGATDLS